MRRIKGGFTLIEVALFLAITGLLFLGITLGVQNSIFQQRYNDSIQNFAEFLRGVYGEVMNVQNVPKTICLEDGEECETYVPSNCLRDGEDSKDVSIGASQCAILGKLVNFGEDDSDTIYVYDVVGSANNDISAGNTVQSLMDVGADVVDVSGRLYSVVDNYRPKWSAEIQNSCNGDNCDESYTRFRGALLIVRHPKSGTVQTLVKFGAPVNVSEEKNNVLVKALDENEFSTQQVDFCINPNGDEVNNLRADVRIPAGARNSSGIEIIMDSSNNACRSDTE